MPKPSLVVPVSSSTPSPSPDRAAGASPPGARGADVEVVPAGTRRKFSASEKLRIVKAADAALASGERGAVEALLRREGLYSSHLSSWRRQLAQRGEEGLAARKPGRKARKDEKDRRIDAMTRELATVKRKLEVAEAVIELQKKAHAVLGLALPDLDGLT